MKTIEQKTSDTILEKPTQIEVSGKTYTVAPPSVATLIMVSSAISRLPKLELTDGENVIRDVLRTAHKTEELGEVMAILILGAKRIKAAQRGKWYDRFIKRHSELEELSARILEDYSPSKLLELATELLSRMEIADFFGLTIFLTQVNTTAPTRKMETSATEATAFGQ